MGFMTLLVPMHAMMVAIFLFLYHILVVMADAIAEKMASLGEAGRFNFRPGRFYCRSNGRKYVCLLEF